jgi:hypothetical protein
MKKIFVINAFLYVTFFSFGQEALKIQSGGSITIQSGVELVLQGGLTLDNGSSLHNNGTISLKNNSVSNISNWSDNSILGALTGTGIVIFNSTNPQQFAGPTSFYTVYINTNDLTINNDLNISNLLRLINGKINTANYVVALVNTAAASLENDITNTNYSNSWVNGDLRRSIATNTSSYDFPVGNSARSNLLKFLNNNLTGPTSLTSSFIPKAGTDAGLNVVENGNTYSAVNNGGVWKLVPNTAATSGNYALHLYFNGFSGLLDNQFGILRRPDASSNATDWIVPTGSLLEPLNGTGRKVSDGFARRYNISDFSQFGIGEFNSGTPCEITGQSQVCIGSLNNIYSGPAGMTTYFWTVTGAGFAGSNTGQTLNVTVPNAPGTFTINLTTTLNGVQSQCSKTVSITPTPACDITGPGEICFSPVNNITYSGPGNMTTYFWTTSPGLQIVGPNNTASVNVTTVAPGPQQVTLNATWLSGCVSQCSKMINVKPIPPCDITGDANVTAATTNNQYYAPANMNSYSWSVSGNGSIVGSNTEQTVSVTAGATGSFTLTLNTILNGCTSSCDKTVTVNPSTTLECSVTGSDEVCSNTTGNIYAGPANMGSYSWSISGNGSIAGADNSQSVTVTAGSTGSFILILNTTLNEATAQCSKTVTVKAVPACDITGSSTVTTGTTDNIYSAPLNMSSYSWTISGNGSIAGANDGQTVNITAGAAGSYTLTLNVTLNGCTTTCTKTVAVNPSSTLECTVTGADEVCSNSTGNTYTGTAGMSSYIWSITGNGTIEGSANDQSVSVTVGSAGSFTLTLHTTLNEATAQCNKLVTIKELPFCSITGSSTVAEESTGNIYSAPASMSSYSWSVSGNGSIVGSAIGQSVNVTAGAAVSYTLTLTSELNGCSVTCAKTVTVNPITTLECVVTGAAEVCSGSAGNMYAGPANMSSYSWSITGDGTITGSTTDATVSITAIGAGSYSLTLQTTLNGVSCMYIKAVTVNECVSACTYTQGFYGNTGGNGCDGSSSVSTSQMMLNAFGTATSKVFGSEANRRFFTLYPSDITGGAIYNMLPGGGGARAIDIDNKLPYDGASYSEVSSWKLVPIQQGGPQTGKIRNSLLAQTITLWFNLATSNTLGTISLSDDTLITKATANCGSNVSVGDGIKFSLPHNIVVYLNGNNGYSATVDGLFQLANDILGGVNTSVNAAEVQQAIDIINNAFDGCRILTGTIPYSVQFLVKTQTVKTKETPDSWLKVTAYPNPYTSRFNLAISSPVSGEATIEFFTVNGSKVYEMKKLLPANVRTTIAYTGPVRFATLLYRMTIGKYSATGIVIKPN